MTMYLGQHDLGTWRLISDVRRGTMPTLLHDWANTVHYSADTSTYQVVNELDQIWTFSRNSETWAWVEDSNGDPVLKKFAVDEPVENAIDPATGQALGYRALQGFTNSLLWSRDLSNAVWSNSAAIAQDAVGLDGVANTAWTVTDDSSVDTEQARQNVPVADDSNTHSAAIYIKKDNDESRFPELRVSLTGSSTLIHAVDLNTKTGAAVARRNDGGDSFSVEDAGGWWRLVVAVTNNGTGNTTLEVVIEAAVGSTLGGVDASATGSIVYDFGGVYLNYP